MNIKKNDLLLYAVTDRTCLKNISITEAVEQAIIGGVTCVQLREKNITQSELIALGKSILAVCKKYNVPLIINDDYEAAIKCGADGVHVGIEDAPVSKIRNMAGDSFIIGATAKTVEQAREAELSGADYIGVGAVFPSPTKSDAIRITSDQLSEICHSVQIPAVAIGGITIENIHKIKGCGNCGIAVVSAIFGAEDIKKAAGYLRTAVIDNI